jgi:hypothetical protein
VCCNTGGLCEYLCCFLWLIRHFVMDQNRLTEYFGLCVAFAMRACGWRASGSAFGSFLFPHRHARVRVSDSTQTSTSNENPYLPIDIAHNHTRNS